MARRKESKYGVLPGGNVGGSLPAYASETIDAAMAEAAKNCPAGHEVVWDGSCKAVGYRAVADRDLPGTRGQMAIKHVGTPEKILGAKK